ncbi:MAG: UGSC family (seleno)protein [Alphaproteobacteria bacterium]
MGLALALERQGVPTVPVNTHVFARLARATALAEGMPTARGVFVPQPVVGRTEGELRAYIEGTDPILKQPFMKGVIEGLTLPLTDEDLKGATFERSTPRLLEPDTEDNLRRLFIENHWTDYLPVILPTEQRVEAMLKGTKVAADKIVGRLRPTAFREFWEFDVEKVAVNSVMAGARPEYLPVVLAMAASGITSRSSSTTSFATVSIVNGPIRKELGMNDGIGAMGPYNEANVTIGRAFNLTSQNVQGGSVPGETYMGTLGNSMSFSSCYPEAEERSPWGPFHVDQGFKPSDSTVSVFMGGWYTISGYGPRDNWQATFKRTLLAIEHFSPPLIIMDPLVARDFVALGFSKESLIQWFADNVKIRAADYWDDQHAHLLRPLAVAGVEPYASRLKAGPDEMIKLLTPEIIHIVVLGGETQAGFKIVGGSYGGRGATHSGSPPGLIDAWR